MTSTRDVSNYKFVRNGQLEKKLQESVVTTTATTATTVAAVAVAPAAARFRPCVYRSRVIV